MEKWLPICKVTDIADNTGICAKVGNHQVAVFRSTRTASLHAIANFDPIGRANVLSRGMIGNIGDRLCVASPLYKQHFDLQTGQCIEDEQYTLEVFDVRERDGLIEVKHTEQPASAA